MEVLASRVLLHPADFDTSVRFYRETLGFHVYREWGEPGQPGHGIVFFLGGSYLEISGSGGDPPSGKLELWLQVRDVDQVHRHLEAEGVEIVEAPVDKPWGLREMRTLDPDGVSLVIIEIPEEHPLRRRH